MVLVKDEHHKVDLTRYLFTLQVDGVGRHIAAIETLV